MLRFSFSNLFMAAALALGISAVGVAPSPGYADGGSDPCAGMSGSERRKCRQNNNRADHERYYKGYWLAKAGRYEEALTVLRQVKDKNNPAVLNYIGYSTRKLGDVDGALVYYKKALKIAPDFTLARSYMGEAYLQKGDAAKAKEQLSQIAARCGVTCQEYATLAQEIKQFEMLRG